MTSPVSIDGNDAVETSVRQLIANGKFKTALESAKQFHKARHSGASESLLLDAYAARIQSLLDQNLEQEAKSLIDLVKERFPKAKDRLERVGVAACAHGDLSGLLQPLNDPQLSAERRIAIENALQTQVTDLAAVANCAVLPPEHSLRQAAAALAQAFSVVTSGPVTEEQIALPEVSHRSPFAPWKLLIRAIACLHRDEDEACLKYLGAIKPDSVPARLIPAMQTMLGVKTGAALKPAEVALVARTSVNVPEFRAALENLDRAFGEDRSENVVFKAVRAAVRECQRSAPDLLKKMKQFIAVRGAVNCLDEERLLAALDGGVRQDAAFFRMYAYAMEHSGEPEDLEVACELWDTFRLQAVREGLFNADGVEVATLYLHMAEILDRVPDELLREFRRPIEPGRKGRSAEDRYFLFPEKLFARACAIDPHEEGFSKWLGWAAAKSVSAGERVAGQWHKIRPNDIEPLLYLMKQADKRDAIPTALGYLAKAERIDAVHATVRAARMRLLAAGAMRHLQQKKPHLAAEKLALMTALPQSQQGSRPAFLAALRHLICAASEDKEGAAAARLNVESLIGGSVAAGCLIFGVAAASKRRSVYIPPVRALSKEERAAIPAALAAVIAVANDLGIKNFQLPVDYFAEAETQFTAVSGALDVEQIHSLGELGLATERPRLAWAASGAGLSRGGTSEAKFMLLRAYATPKGMGERTLPIAAAAAELGRFHGDAEVVDKALGITRNPFGGETFTLTLDEAREVVRKELASPAYPSIFGGEPDYGDLIRLKLPRPPSAALDEADMKRAFDEHAPKDLPPDVSKMLFEIMKEAFVSGEIPEMVPGGRKKGRRS